MARYIFPLSADPPHYGHLAVVEKLALGEQDEVLVVILQNGTKGSSLFPLQERAEMCRALFQHIPQVKVSTTKLPLVDFWNTQDRPIIIRGIRGQEDQEYERRQASYHAIIDPQIRESYLFVETDNVASSTLVKGMVAQGFWVHQLVPVSIERRLRWEILQQDLWNVTGRITTGKSTLARQLCFHMRQSGQGDALHVDVDKLVWEIWNETSPRGERLRSILQSIDPLSVKEGRVVRERVRAMSVGGKLTHVDLLGDVERKVREHIAHFQRRFPLEQKTIFIEWALTAEMRLGHWGLHNSILTTIPHSGGGHDPGYVEKCLHRQAPWEEARRALLIASEEAIVHVYRDEDPPVFWESVHPSTG